MGYFKLDYTKIGEGIIEDDTVACGHCQAVIFKKDIRLNGGGWKCSGCGKYMCKHCVGSYHKHPTTEQVQKCDPWQEKVEQAVKYGWGY